MEKTSRKDIVIVEVRELYEALLNGTISRERLNSDLDKIVSEFMHSEHSNLEDYMKDYNNIKIEISVLESKYQHAIINQKRSIIAINEQQEKKFRTLQGFKPATKDDLGR